MMQHEPMCMCSICESRRGVTRHTSAPPAPEIIHAEQILDNLSGIHTGLLESAPPAPAAQETAHKICVDCYQPVCEHAAKRLLETASLRAEVARLQERINRAAIDEAKLSLNARETQEALQRELASTKADLQQAEDELQGARVAEKAYISANNERIALLAQVARLEKERDELREAAQDALGIVAGLMYSVKWELAPDVLASFPPVHDKLVKALSNGAAEARIRELEGEKK